MDEPLQFEQSTPVQNSHPPINSPTSTPNGQGHITVQLTPSQVEALAGLGLNAVLINGESNPISPTSATSANSAQLEMDLNASYGYYPQPVQPQPAPAQTSAAPSLPPAAAANRHHPYAHPSRVNSLQHSQSSGSALPLYLSQSQGGGPSSPASPTAGLSSDSATSPQLLQAPPSAGPLLALGTTSTAPPSRVHSAPAVHLRTLSMSGLGDVASRQSLKSAGGDSDGSALDEMSPFGSQSVASLGQSWDAATAAAQGGMSLPPTTGGVATGADWDGDRNMATLKQDELYSVPPPPPPTQASSFSPYYQQAPPPPPTPVHLESPVEAIALLRNRLPIMEAALSATAADPGNDEEEIWKGVESTYAELKRIMVARRDVRRGLKQVSRPYAIEMDSPATTPVDPSHSSATSQFLAAHAVPPLLHSQSTPEVPLLAQAQQVRAQQHQLAVNEAQLRAEVEAQVRAEHEARARAESDARARAEQARQEADARARAEDEARVKLEEQEAEAQQRAEQQLQEQQYRHALAQQQQQQAMIQHAQQVHQQQLAAAQQQQQQYDMPQYSSSLLAAPVQVGVNHIPHVPSPLSVQIPTSSIQMVPQQSQAPTAPVTRARAMTGSFGQGSSYEVTPTDLSMGAVMQMHMGAIQPQVNGYGTGVSTPTDSSEPTTVSLSSLDGGVNSATENGRWPPPAQVAPPAAAIEAEKPTLTTSVPPTSLTSRPSRSRAASNSGYAVSASGSRSRAASGSGYQSLLDGRSRAASSASSIFGTQLDDDDHSDEDEDVPTKTSSQMGAASAGVDPALRAQIDPIFLEFLAELCSNLEATDSKGEPIHQTLMAKKMDRLDASPDFRPFKFRIQAFTTAFSEKLAESGFPDSEVPIKRIRQYLWAQPCISRFNDDGKKAKSKGNHIWTIEAKKVPDKKWIFREFTRCIKGAAPSVAFAGMPWEWAPRVWDPQCSGSAIGASFSSPALPTWLHWEDNVLSGRAPEQLLGQEFEITAVATFQQGNKVQQLEAKTVVTVRSPNDLLNEPVLRDHAMDDDGLDHGSHSSLAASPVLHRSPSLAQPALFESPVHVAQSGQTQLLPSLMPPTGTPMTYLQEDHAMEGVHEDPNAAAAMMHQQQQLAMSYHLQQQAQAQAVAMYPQPSTDPALMTQTPLESQAAVHQRWAAALGPEGPFAQGQSSPAVPLSYAPPPEMLSSALHQAQFERSNSSGGYPIHAGMASIDLSQTGTPIHHHPQHVFSVDPSQL